MCVCIYVHNKLDMIACTLIMSQQPVLYYRTGGAEILSVIFMFC